MRTTPTPAVLISTLGLVLAAPALGQAPPDYDFRWARIGDAGNAASPFAGQTLGRGRVDHEYRISRLEITTGQWMEFVNTYSTRFADMAWFGAPTYWGADLDPDYHGVGNRWRLRGDANAANLPVAGISWRDAARYCNWLCNEKAPTRAAIADGAYDTSTFSGNRRDGFTDQAAHRPDAKFWIPTLDEWMKAVYYDPNRYASGLGGWWRTAGMQDDPLTPGLPGQGQTSAGYEFDPVPFPPEEWNVALGAYTTTQSAWGLWDGSGGTSEWTEDWLFTDPVRSDRVYDGAAAGWYNYYTGVDDVTGYLADGPQAGQTHVSFRVASSAPAPGTPLASMGAVLAMAGRRARRGRAGAVANKT